MLKFCIVIALAVAGTNALQVIPPENAIPEPYSYGYETESHAAAEQRDPAGKVTGYYTLADADGRQRRVDYIADELGFRAKVETNEVGTKSDSPADVELLAAPPTREQLAQGEIRGQAIGTAAPITTPRYVAGVQAAPARSYLQQPYANTGYYGNGNGYGYGYGGAYNRINSGAYTGLYDNGYYGTGYGYGAASRGYGYGVGAPAAGYGYGLGYANTGYRNYNNHLPSQYYRSIGSTAAPALGAGAYASLPVAGASGVAGNFRDFRTIGVPAGAAYPGAYSNGNLLGSSNYIVLKKRDSDAAAPIIKKTN